MSATPESIAAFESQAQRLVGKPIMECNWDDLQRIRKALVAEVAAEQAAVDQANMALSEIQSCGCSAVIANGDIGTARPVHTCGVAA